jgi:hypothetical protein
MLVIQARFESGRAASVVAILTAGGAGAVVFAGAVSVLAGIRPATLLRLGRGSA